MNYLNFVNWYGWKVRRDAVPEKRAGIYKITNLVNDKALIGESQDIDARFKRGYVISNDFIQADIDKYTKQGFLVEVVEYLDTEDKQQRLVREAYYIGKLSTLHPQGYNLQLSSVPGGNRGDYFSQKISETVTKLWQDPDYRANIIASREAPEVRQATNKALKAAWERNHAERAEAMRTPEARNAFREGQYKRYENPEEIEKQRRATTERWARPGLKEAQSEKAKAFAATPEGRQIKLDAAAKLVKGSIWINDGLVNKRVPKDQEIPAGWKAGRATNGVKFGPKRKTDK